MSKNIKFCCDNMRQNIEENSIMHYSKVFDEYGINIVEDNSSCILIDFCPWCGRKLPDSKRQEWFYELEKLGFENPLFEESIPENYKNEKWRTK